MKTETHFFVNLGVLAKNFVTCKSLMDTEASVCCSEQRSWMSSKDFSQCSGSVEPQGMKGDVPTAKALQLFDVGWILHTAAPKAGETGC